MDAWKKLKFRLWMELGQHRLALPLFRWYGHARRRGLGRIDDQTEIVIEGYPRSANSFTVAAFDMAQERAVDIVHHLHSPAVIHWAVRRRLPVMVLVRKPVDAVASLLMRSPFMTADRLLKDYVRFFSRVIPVKDRVLIVRFEEAVDDLGAVVQRCNARFGTSFVVPEMTAAYKERCFARLKDVETRMRHAVDEFYTARPSTARDEQKESIRRAVEDGHPDLVRRANAVYEAMLTDS